MGACMAESYTHFTCSVRNTLLLTVLMYSCTYTEDCMHWRLTIVLFLGATAASPGKSPGRKLIR